MSKPGFSLHSIADATQGQGRLAARESEFLKGGAAGCAPPIMVAVAGQPNTGKSTVFNRLTGLRQRVGNWPGKTVDRKQGLVRRGNVSYLLVDLPGTYGLTPNSTEEEIARDHLLFEAPDVVVAVINAAGIERCMYLVAELLLLDAPVVIALNMMDVAVQEGRDIDHQALERATGLPVVPMVGTARDQRMDELLDAVEAAGRIGRQGRGPENSPVVEDLARRLDGLMPASYPRRWAAGKLVEGDRALHVRLEAELDATGKAALRKVLGEIPASAAMDIYKGRQEWIDAVCADAVRTQEGRRSPTDRWDQVLLHPFWGRIVAFLVIPVGILLGVLLGMCTGGMVLMTALSSGPRIKAAWPGIMGSLTADALVPALGWIMALICIIGFIYAIFHFLEDIGYLARAAYLMDPLLHGLGVDGKSGIPLLMGMLCNTVAIAGSRVVGTRGQRLITLSMLPFLPCSGQTGVAVLFAFALFPAGTAILVVIGVTALNIALAFLMGAAVNRWLPHPRTRGLVMELPLYHKPNFRTILSGVRTRVEIFTRNTAGFIVAALILVWAVSYFPDGQIESSYLYRIGRFLEPVGALFGFDWRFVVALLSSFVAKEATAGALAVLFAVGTSDHQAIVEALRGAISPQGALAFVVISNLYLPCVASIGALRLELGSWKATVGLLLVMLAVALGTGLIVYHLGSFFW